MSHSEILQTITLFAMSDVEADGLTIDRAELSQPGFCDRWRSDPRVTPRVIATGISDMRITAVPGERSVRARGEAGRPMLRIELTWAPDSADGIDEASVLVDGIAWASPTGPSG